MERERAEHEAKLVQHRLYVGMCVCVRALSVHEDDLQDLLTPKHLPLCLKVCVCVYVGGRMSVGVGVGDVGFQHRGAGGEGEGRARGKTGPAQIVCEHT